MGTFISNEKDAIDIRHIVAVATGEDGHHTVLTDCGWRIGVTDEMFRKIMTTIYRSYEAAW